MNFFLLGLNHKTSNIGVREKLSFSPSHAEEFIAAYKGILKTEELLCLSTCNRTEFYGTHGLNEDIKSDLKNRLKTFKKLENAELPEESLYYYEDDSAVRHLFNVCAGIDSLVVGEPQILGQVKEAYTIATKAGSNGPIINKVFHQAFRVGKRARTETQIGKGIVSVSHAAVELSKKIFSNLKDRKVLLVGAGETGELAMKHFLKEGIQKIYISNRSIEKAKALSLNLGGSVVPFEEFKSTLLKVDIAIFSTSAEKFILSDRDLMEDVLQKRTEPLFIVDISVPRNVDPKLSALENIFLYDIDDLNGVVKENVKLREKEVERVKEIVTQEMKKYREWRGNLQFEPLLRFLKEEFEKIRTQELSKNISKFEGKQEEVEKLTRAITNKIINRPLQKLRRFNINTHSYVLRSSLLEELFREEGDED